MVEDLHQKKTSKISFLLRAKLKQHPPAHHEEWMMVSDPKTVLC
jgi:hypothetical protein